MSRYTLYNRILPKVMAVLLVLALLMPAVPAVSAAGSGSCGRDLEWSYALGTLTITGKGPMDDYERQQDVPWYAFREQIQRLVLPKGLTHVGRRAFFNCRSLTSVSIPASVKSIGDMAFMQCERMEILILQEGLESIGENAFESCAALQSLRLPVTLKTLKNQAFYRCSSLRVAEIPYATTDLGQGIFGYCESLIRATVRANVHQLPSWTFYGCTSLVSIDLAEEIKSVGSYSVYDCENLSVIYYGGEPGDAEELRHQISEDNNYFSDNGIISDNDPDSSESGSKEVTDEKGDTIEESSTVTDTGDATITVTEKENVSDPDAEEPPTEIDATVEDKNGWEDVEEAVKDALKGGNSVEIDVYVPADTDLPDSLLEELAGKDVVMNVTTADGGKYTLDFSQIVNVEKIKGLDLSYQLEVLDKTYEAFGGATGYRLKFSKSCTINAEILIQLPAENARKTITLYQLEGGKPRQLQSVVADENAIAHFYLASVDRKTEYLLGIDVPTIQTSELLIPESLASDYGITYRLNNEEYVVTGRVSSWGLTSVQVTQVMIGIMLSTASIVGLLMYARNKRKLRKGYTPGWDDAEDEE